MNSTLSLRIKANFCKYYFIFAYHCLKEIDKQKLPTDGIKFMFDHKERSKQREDRMKRAALH